MTGTLVAAIMACRSVCHLSHYLRCKEELTVNPRTRDNPFIYEKTSEKMIVPTVPKFLDLGSDSG